MTSLNPTNTRELHPGYRRSPPEALSSKSSEYEVFRRAESRQPTQYRSEMTRIASVQRDLLRTMIDRAHSLEGHKHEARNQVSD
jgi:hypothetical protein